MSKSMLFLESVPFLEKISSLKLLNNKIIIAANPEMILECEKRDIAHKIPEDYFNPMEFFKMSSDCDCKTKEFCEEWDRWLWETDPRFKELDIHPFEDTFYIWKIILDTIRIKSYEWLRVLEGERPEEIIIEDKGIGPYDKKENLSFFMESMPLYQSILDLIAAQTGNPKIIKIVADSTESENKNKSYSSPILKKAIIWRKFQKLFSLFKSFALPAKKELIEKPKSILMEKHLPAGIKKDLRDRGFNAIEIDFGNMSSCDSHNEPLNWGNNINKKLNSSKWEFLNINLFPVLMPVVEKFLQNVGDFIKAAETIKGVLKKNNDAIIFIGNSFATTSYIHAGCIARILKNNAVKRAILQHGGAFHIAYTPGYEHADFSYADVYFVYGDAMKEYFQTFCDKYSFQVYPVGNPIKCPQPFINSYKNKKKKIFFLPHCLNRNMQYLGWNSAEYTDNLMWKNSCNIIDVLGKYQDKYHIIIKAHHGERGLAWLFKKYLSHKGFYGIDIENSIGFDRVADESDLTIINYLAGGCPVFQSYHLKADIFIYENHKLTPKAEEIFANDFYCFTTEGKFIEELDNYLKEGIFYRKNKLEFGKDFCNDESGMGVGEAMARYISSISK